MCSAIISGVASSEASKYTLRVSLVAALFRSSRVALGDLCEGSANAVQGADSGRVNALGGSPGDKCEVDVGVVMGESMEEERDTTYACFVSFDPCALIEASLASMAASSLCTATEKRRQKLGSWTMVGDVGLGSSKMFRLRSIRRWR